MDVQPTRPRISVIVAMRDAEATLAAQLEALAAQTYTGDWELILADNGSTDASREVGRSYESRFPALRIIDAADRPGCGHARNVAAREAAGEVLAFCDADDVVSPGWLAAIAAEVSEDVLVGGRLDFERLNERNWPIIVDQQSLEVHLGFMGAAPGSNLAVSRAAFEALGGFVESYTYGEDVDFSWRAQLAGYPLVYAPDAVISWRTKATLRTLLQQVYKVGRIDARLYREYRDRGLRREPLRGTLKTSAWLTVNLPSVLRARELRMFWAQWAAYRTGRLRGSIEQRVVFV